MSGFLGNVLGLLIPALLGLGLWRVQLIEKRRYEIAEQLVQVVTRVVGALRYVRDPAGQAGEGGTRKPELNETEEQTMARNGLFIPIERLNKHAQTFRELLDAQVLCEMHFGAEHVKPFERLFAVRREVLFAAMKELHGRPEDITQDTVYGIGEDKIAEKIDAALDDIKRLAQSRLRPHWITLLLPFVTHEHIAWGSGKVRHWWSRLWGRA